MHVNADTNSGAVFSAFSPTRESHARDVGNVSLYRSRHIRVPFKNTGYTRTMASFFPSPSVSLPCTSFIAGDESVGQIRVLHGTGTVIVVLRQMT